MKHFDDVTAVFRLIDAHFEQRMIDALLGDGGIPGYDTLEAQRRINAQAYFALLFSQLEAEANSLCGDLIGHMQAQPASRDRRAWDIIDDKNIRGLHFMKRVALLTTKGGTVYKRVKELYDTRNSIAHGDLLSDSLDLTPIAEEMQDIAAQLKDVR